MRRPVVALSVGVLALSGACATSTGSAAPTRYGAPTAERPSQPTAAERDSIFAQAVADREGPRVDVHAIITQASSSRRVRAAFNVEDDSYVLIGQVDGSGTVRIIFPTDPRDDGFVRGGKRYETTDVFAGFADQYRYRFNYARYYQHGLNSDAYDGALGYMFVVASWRPMHFDRFASDGVWDSYEIADEESLRDPKPAIYELASLLVGENREAYTVKFARYYNTTDVSPGFGNASSAFGYGPGLCGAGLGYQTFGWSDAMFPGLNSPYEYEIANGLDFTYRGVNYFYSPAGDCYYQSAAFFGGRATNLPVMPVPVNPTKPRVIAATGPRRPPVTPPKIGPLAPQGQDVNAATQLPRTSPSYRQRGLLTDDENGPTSGRREPRNVPFSGANSRPAIQQMLSHHMQESNNGNDGWSRATTRSQASDVGSRAWSRPTTAGESGTYNPPRMRTESSGQSSNRGSSAGRYEGARSAPPPRSEPSSSGGSSGRYSAPSSSGSSGTSHPSAPASSGSSSSSGSSGSVKPPV
jgi:hypothetical protein